MKPIVYHCEADVELVSAAKYYRCQSETLARAFLHAVHLALAKIQANPERFLFYDRPTRSCLLQKFPYRLVYEAFPDAIQILAVMHTSRNSTYWKHRLS